VSDFSPVWLHWQALKKIDRRVRVLRSKLQHAEYGEREPLRAQLVRLLTARKATGVKARAVLAAMEAESREMLKTIPE
jgi:hypothetical protein